MSVGMGILLSRVITDSTVGSVAARVEYMI
jgi:hypothetical protein